MEDDMAASVRGLSENMQAGEFLKFLKTRPKEERWQLIEGVAVMMNPPTLVHQVIALNLRDLLKDALARKKLDLLVVNDCAVRIPSVSHSLPRPDVIVIPGIADYQVYAER